MISSIMRWVPSPGATDAESTRLMSKFLRDVMKANLDSKNFRLVSPDESVIATREDVTMLQEVIHVLGENRKP